MMWIKTLKVIFFITFGFIIGFIFHQYFHQLTQDQIDRVEWGNWFAAVGTIAAVGVSLWQNIQQRKQYEEQLKYQDKKHREGLNYNQSIAIFEMMIVKTSDILRDKYSRYLDDESTKSANQVYHACAELVMNIINFRFDDNMDQRVINLLNKYVLMHFKFWINIIMYQDVSQSRFSTHLKTVISQDTYNEYKDRFLRRVILQFDTLDALKKDKEYFGLILKNLLFVGDKRIKENDLSNIEIIDKWKEFFSYLGSLSEDDLVKSSPI